MAIYHNCKAGILIDIANLFKALHSFGIVDTTIQLGNVRTKINQIKDMSYTGVVDADSAVVVDCSPKCYDRNSRWWWIFNGVKSTGRH